MARKPVKTRATRTLRAAGPIDQSRGAGAPAPASAAASAPRPLYDPDAAREPVELNPLRAASFAEEVRESAIPIGPQVSAEGPLAAPEPGDDLEADIARVRGMRRPLGVSQQKLALPVRPGYQTHWFNDEGGRIDDALDNGWAHRKDKDGKPLKRAVGRGRDAGVLYGYAMILPMMFYLEDQTARNQLAADKMASVKANPFKAQAGATDKSDAGKFYSPVEEPLTIEKR